MKYKEIKRVLEASGKTVTRNKGSDVFFLVTPDFHTICTGYGKEDFKKKVRAYYAIITDRSPYVDQ